MVEPSGGCIALLHVQQHVGEASIKGPQRGASHGYTPCPEGCVPRALNTPLCTNLWHTHATCITVANLPWVIQVWMRPCANAVVLTWTIAEPLAGAMWRSSMGHRSDQREVLSACSVFFNNRLLSLL